MEGKWSFWASSNEKFIHKIFPLFNFPLRTSKLWLFYVVSFWFSAKEKVTFSTFSQLPYIQLEANELSRDSRHIQIKFKVNIEKRNLTSTLWIIKKKSSQLMSSINIFILFPHVLVSYINSTFIWLYSHWTHWTITIWTRKFDPTASFMLCKLFLVTRLLSWV